MMNGWFSWVRKGYFDEDVSFGEDVLEFVGLLNEFLLDDLHGVDLAVLELADEEDLAEDSLANHAEELVVVYTVVTSLAHVMINILDVAFFSTSYKLGRGVS